MKTKVKVYIASQYSVGDKIENVNRQITMADKLMNLGFIPFVPLYSHYQHTLYPRSYDSWMELDYTWIDSCDCLLRLTGESSGADKEIEYALSIGIPAFYSVLELTEYYTKTEK